MPAKIVQFYCRIEIWIAPFIVCAALLLTFNLAIQGGMHNAISNPEDDHRINVHNALFGDLISSAISSMEYGLSGYVNYKKVYDTLISGNLSNEAISRALSLQDVAGDGVRVPHQIDLGFISYAKLSFLIFGYRTESFLYLYFLIFGISVALYCIEFQSYELAKILLISFLIANYMVIAAIDEIGPQLGSVYNFRFITVLAILPSFHIATLVLRDKTVGYFTYLIAFIQGSIIVWIVLMRMSALWIMLFLLAWSVCYVGHTVFRKQCNSARNDQRLRLFFRTAISRLWPIMLVACMMMAAKGLRPLFVGSDFSNSTAAHLFFHPLFIGLSVHPDIGRSFSETDYASWRNGAFDKICEEGDISGRTIASYARRWVCANYKDDNFFIDVAFMTKYRHTDDQHGFSAVFKVLREKGESELSIFTFSPADSVDYKSSFSRFSDEKDREATTYKRPYDPHADLNSVRYEKLLSEIVYEVYLHHPAAVAELLFIIRPAQVVFYYVTQYLQIQTLPPMPFLLVALLYTVAYFFRSSAEKLKRVTGLLVFALMFSLVVPLAIYPAYYALSDTALVTTIILFLTIAVFAGKCTIVFLQRVKFGETYVSQRSEKQSP